MAFPSQEEIRLIDLHCHLLPGIDDGAANLEISLEMARLAVADGISVCACTPHIQPGVFNNEPDDIRARIVALQVELDAAGIPLRLVHGSDAHIRPDFVAALQTNRVLALNETRYVLVEPPHHTHPPRLENLLFDILTAGYVPVVTHPERLRWMPEHYNTLARYVDSGVWMQITAGSVMGRFGAAPKSLSERMLADGLVHIIATDAHSPRRRPPFLREGMLAAAAIVGEDEARRMVEDRPRMILDNVVERVRPVAPTARKKKKSFFSGIFGRA